MICEKSVVVCPSKVKSLTSCAHCPWLTRPWVILLCLTKKGEAEGEG
jgi:hypothetical protein